MKPKTILSAHGRDNGRALGGYVNTHVNVTIAENIILSFTFWSKRRLGLTIESNISFGSKVIEVLKEADHLSDYDDEHHDVSSE